MTYEQWHITELRKINNEINELKRHTDFLYTMSLGENANIDWDCYWTWYAHSDCDAADAVRYSQIED